MIRSVTAFQRSPVTLGGPQLGREVYRRRPITMLLGFICPRGSECSAVHGTILLKNSSQDRKSTRLNSRHHSISYAVVCLKKQQRHPPAPTGLARHEEDSARAGRGCRR